MARPDFTSAVWHKSSRCSDGGNCVEVAWAGGWVGVRNSKYVEGCPILVFDEDEWQTFVAGVRDREFDR